MVDGTIFQFRKRHRTRHNHRKSFIQSHITQELIPRNHDYSANDDNEPQRRFGLGKGDDSSASYDGALWKCFVNQINHFLTANRTCIHFPVDELATYSYTKEQHKVENMGKQRIHGIYKQTQGEVQEVLVLQFQLEWAL